MVYNSENQKLLGVHFDNDLRFNTHVYKICKKASQKLHALARVSNHMSFEKKKLILNAFIFSQFSYCPLIWMCCNRTANAQIDRIHEKALRIIYNDHKSSFCFLLEKSKTVRIHHRNLQLLATEMYKVQKDISPIFMRDIFQLKESTYSLRHTSTFQTGNVRTVFNGTETISYLGPKNMGTITK